MFVKLVLFKVLEKDLIRNRAECLRHEKTAFQGGDALGPSLSRERSIESCWKLR